MNQFGDFVLLKRNIFCLKEIFRQHFVLRDCEAVLRDCEANIAWSAHFVNGLLPELNDLLKKHKLRWEISPLSELPTSC